ncbi:MAG TPA: DUF4142 domain-containing protein [Chitinophagaceae bacterium]|nr:DUF4142 domain-containing protein [Chitinophagaceae bacterium]
MKKSIWMVMIGLLTTALFVACDNNDDNVQPKPTLDQYDINFLNKATQQNRATILLNTLAKDSGTNAGVKQYAQDMITNYTSVQKSIDSIANIYSLQLPTTGDSAVSLFKDNLMMMARGKSFDTSFVGYQMRLLDSYLPTWNDASANAKNTGVKNFATQLIPTWTSFRNRADSLFGSL